MIKKLISTAILSSVIGSASANPELGDMTLSAGKHPLFNATIAIDALPSELTNKKLKVKLGTISDFFRHNIEYDKQVSGLQFKVGKDSNGKPLIRVRSIREITASKLKAVVKLTVGKQKIYGIYDFRLTPNKERHVRLNLLNSDHKPAEHQLITQDLNPSLEKPLLFTASTASLYEENTKEISIPLYGYYTVKPGQSISIIAMDLLPRYPEVGNWRTLMNKLAALNPDAFINGDINQLRANAQLTLPGISENLAPVTKKTENAVLGSPDNTSIYEPVMAQQQKGEESANFPGRHSLNSMVIISDLPAELAGRKDLEVRLGSITDYYRQGIGYNHQVASLRFEITANSNEETRIRAYSNQEISAQQLTAVVKLSAGRKTVYGIYEILSDKSVSHTSFSLLGTDKSKKQQVVKHIRSLTEQPVHKDITTIPPSPPSGEMARKQALAALQNKLKGYEQAKNQKTEATTEQLPPKNTTASMSSDEIARKQALEILRNKLKGYEQAQSQETKDPRTETNILNERKQDRRLLSEKSLYRRDGHEGSEPNSLAFMAGRDTYQVAKGDTIGTIAMKLSRNYPEAKSWRVVMELLAMQNTHAFIDGDINKIRTGTLLTLPENHHFDQLYDVAIGESISSIAMSLESQNPQPGGWKGIMKQLIHMNPEAFINGDTQKLRENAVLIVPGSGLSEIEAEIQELPGKQQLKTNSLVKNLVKSPVKLRQLDQEVTPVREPLPRETQSSLEKQSVQEPPIQKVSIQKASIQEPSIQDIAETSYRVTESMSLAAIAHQLTPDYPQFETWYDFLQALVKLNPSLLINNDISSIKEGTVLQLPEKKSSEHQAEHKAIQSLPAERNDGEQKSTKPAKNPMGNVTAPSYDKISKSLLSRIGNKTLYDVPDGYTISMVAIKLFPRFPEYESWPALMNALYQLNPEAFIDRDINRLRHNSRLTLPQNISS